MLDFFLYFFGIGGWLIFSFIRMWNEEIPLNRAAGINFLLRFWFLLMAIIIWSHFLWKFV